MREIVENGRDKEESHLRSLVASYMIHALRRVREMALNAPRSSRGDVKEKAYRDAGMNYQKPYFDDAQELESFGKKKFEIVDANFKLGYAKKETPEA